MAETTRVYQIGEAMPKADAYAKVRGAELFAADYYGEDLLIAGVKRAGVPHATIKKIEVTAALTVGGVVKILTAGDVTGSNRQGVVQKDQPVLVDERVRHAGDAVALVIATSKEALQEAIDRIELHLEPLPAVFDPELALKEDAPLLHPKHPGGNALFHGLIEKGEGEAGFAGCHAVVEGVFELPRQAHVFLEAENGRAYADALGNLEIIASTQTPFRDRMEVAEALGVDLSRLRLIAPSCGGGFGGKDGITVQSLLGLAALACPGRPVKMQWSREESFVAGAKRHPARLYYRLGGDREGRLVALSARIYYDTGPYDHLGGAVAALGLEHAGGPYQIANTRIEAWAVYTNNPLSGAFRGFGVPQVAAAIESLIDALAERLTISPLTIRQKNALTRGDRCPAGITRDGTIGLSECLQTVEKHPLWRERGEWRRSAPVNRFRGTGLAAVWHGMGYGPVIPDSATAGIEVTPRGKIRVLGGVVDMGQGNGSTYLQLAGDILSQPLGNLELVLPDTRRTFPSGSASASRTTFTFGNALIGAAEMLKARLLARGADLFMAKKETEMVLVPGALRHLPSGRELPLKKLAAYLNPAELSVTNHYRTPVAKETVGDENLRLHGFPHTIFSFAVQLARVEIDALTGRVIIHDFLTVTDCGRILNPVVFAGQQEGAVVQGIGYALQEEAQAREGRLTTQDLTTYIVPTAQDVPAMQTINIALHEPSGPFGLKGAGEIGIDGPLPALANAVADACGARLYNFPMTAERVLQLLLQVKSS